jgi:DNA-binding MarR family transcriptional regulator
MSEAIRPRAEGQQPPSHPWSVLFDLWLLKQAVYPLIDQAIEATGLSAEEFGLYLLIEEFQPVTPSDIARHSGMRANTVSAALQRLERRGHVVRTPNDRDGRSVLISLSEDGLAATLDAAAGNARLLDRLGELVDVDELQVAVDELNQAVRLIANLPPRVPSSGRGPITSSRPRR